MVKLKLWTVKFGNGTAIFHVESCVMRRQCRKCFTAEPVLLIVITQKHFGECVLNNVVKFLWQFVALLSFNGVPYIYLDAQAADDSANWS